MLKKAAPQPMRLFLFASLILLPCADTAYAIDQLQVVAPRVNVRAAPSLKSKILTKLSWGKVVQRIGERGMWTKVHIGAKIPRAWIYSPLLSRLTSPFERFQHYYAQRNKTTRSAAGHDLFTKVHTSGNDVIYVETSRFWNTMSATEQTSQIESLY